MQPFPPPVQIGEISEQELEYDGSDSKKPLLVEIKGQIFDVSQSRFATMMVEDVKTYEYSLDVFVHSSMLLRIGGLNFSSSLSESLGDGDGRKRFSRATDILVKILQSCGLFELIFIVTIVCQA
ncbi:hypothetical protein T459_09303 [Capsicum annuum]|uniref:Uncharacterized protein n=1 Tax=Capsicum annuum TaxID=4072 RepID=A0A2G2ZYZ3_CAPAN|nr:hypothetical protein T459_09303 [Capsicum annuum]